MEGEMGRIRVSIPPNRLVGRLKWLWRSTLRDSGGHERPIHGSEIPLSRPYVYGTAAAAVLCFGFGVAEGPRPDTFSFLLLLVLSVLASPLKVALPGAF